MNSLLSQKFEIYLYFVFSVKKCMVLVVCRIVQQHFFNEAWEDKHVGNAEDKNVVKISVNSDLAKIKSRLDLNITFNSHSHIETGPQHVVLEPTHSSDCL